MGEGDVFWQLCLQLVLPKSSWNLHLPCWPHLVQLVVRTIAYSKFGYQPLWVLMNKLVEICPPTNDQNRYTVTSVTTVQLLGWCLLGLLNGSYSKAQQVYVWISAILLPQLTKGLQPEHHEILKENHLNQKKPATFNFWVLPFVYTVSEHHLRDAHVVFGFLARGPGGGDTHHPSSDDNSLRKLPRYRVPQSERRWWHNTPQSNPPGCYGDSTPCWRYHLNTKGGKGVSMLVIVVLLVNDKTRGMFNLSKVWRCKYETWKWWKKLRVRDRHFSMVHIEILMMNHCANIIFYISLLHMGCMLKYNPLEFHASFFTSFCLQL